MGFRRQRRRGRRPGQIVLVDTGVAVVADAGQGIQVHRQLERAQRRVLTHLLGGDLVGGGPEMVIGALRVLGERRAQEPRIRRVVCTGIGVLQLHIGHHGELVPDRSQRAKAGGQLAECALSLRRPARVIAAHRNEDVAQPTHRFGRRLGQGRHGRDHRVEQRQGQGGLHSF